MKPASYTPASGPLEVDPQPFATTHAATGQFTGRGNYNPSIKERMKPRIITLYTSPGCQPCMAIKRWFKKKGVEYTEKDVTLDPQDLAAVKELGYKSAPVVIVSTGDPEVEIHWQGLHMANLEKYTLTTAEQKAA